MTDTPLANVPALSVFDPHMLRCLPPQAVAMIVANVSPGALATIPRENRAVVIHYLQHVSIFTVAKAVDAAKTAPGGGADLPPVVWANHMRAWMCIFRTMDVPGNLREPCGEAYRSPANEVEALCQVCGARWRVNASNPERPVAIGKCPVVGPITWAPKAEALELRTEHGRDIAGWVKCWVHGRDGWDG